MADTSKHDAEFQKMALPEHGVGLQAGAAGQTDDSPGAIGARLRQARWNFRPKLSRQALATRVGVSTKAIQLIEEGKTRHSRYLEPIARALNISLRWLTTGTGSSQEPGDDDRFTELLVMDGVGRLDDLTSLLLPREFLPETAPKAFLWRLADASMEPELPRNALILLDPDSRLEPGRLALIVSDAHGPLVREWWDRGATLELVPRNPAYARISLPRTAVRQAAAVRGWWTSY